MKKRLLKPPSNDGEIIILPSPKEFIGQIKEKDIVGVAHQPYFFNPGVSLKFIFLEKLPQGKKKIIFVDTDKVKIQVKLPTPEGPKILRFLDREEVLFNYLSPSKEIFKDFFSLLETELKRNLSYDKEVFLNFSFFKEIVFKNLDKKFLKEILVESFLQFYKIDYKWCFLTDLFDKDYKEFFLEIYKKYSLFREIFNRTLDEYKNTFRFRFKNFPFPKLTENELPFWILKENKRIRCFKRDVEIKDLDNLKILPRALTLTIFLRLYKLNFFIHGVGGGNYEWVADRIIERFFKRKAPPYIIVSGTFLLSDLKERDFPYFLFSSEKIKGKIDIFKGI
jgi:hypothetical protein